MHSHRRAQATVPLERASEETLPDHTRRVRFGEGLANKRKSKLVLYALFGIFFDPLLPETGYTNVLEIQHILQAGTFCF